MKKSTDRFRKSGTAGSHDVKRVYIDANAVIYYIEQNPRYLAGMLRLMFGADGSDLVHCVTSDLVRLESRVLPLRNLNLLLLSRFDAFFDVNQAHSVRLDSAVFDFATELRAQHGLKTPDALHLAAALQAGCDEFWTNDQRLAKAAQNRLRIVTFESTP
ncbi:MAG: type II toxin-antitoxin system VapC family toxin [Polaromonas sp.]